MENAFWCHPLQGQEGLNERKKHFTCELCKDFSLSSICALIFDTYAAFRDVVGVMHDVSGQAKVTDLDKFALTDQHIPGSEVTMDTLWWN